MLNQFSAKTNLFSHLWLKWPRVRLIFFNYVLIKNMEMDFKNLTVHSGRITITDLFSEPCLFWDVFKMSKLLVVILHDCFQSKMWFQ